MITEAGFEDKFYHQCIFSTNTSPLVLKVGAPLIHHPYFSQADIVISKFERMFFSRNDGIPQETHHEMQWGMGRKWENYCLCRNFPATGIPQNLCRYESRVKYLLGSRNTHRAQRTPYFLPFLPPLAIVIGHPYTSIENNQKVLSLFLRLVYLLYTMP